MKKIKFVIKQSLVIFLCLVILFVNSNIISVKADTIITNPEAHRGNGKILNMQHIHALLRGGIHGRSHIFFAIPVIA